MDTGAVLHEINASAMVPRRQPDWRLFAIASGEAHHAIERAVMPDLWPAYSRMREAAGLGPMDWTGAPHRLAFRVSGNEATLAAGDLKIDRLSRVISEITRNADSCDRARVWTEIDHVMRGARRIYLFGLRRNLTTLSQQIEQCGRDLSSMGIQRIADYQADMARLTREYGAELIVSGMAAAREVA